MAAATRTFVAERLLFCRLARAARRCRDRSARAFSSAVSGGGALGMGFGCAEAIVRVVAAGVAAVDTTGAAGATRRAASEGEADAGAGAGNDVDDADDTGNDPGDAAATATDGVGAGSPRGAATSAAERTEDTGVGRSTAAIAGTTLGLLTAPDTATGAPSTSSSLLCMKPAYTADATTSADAASTSGSRSRR